jgi:NAD(P)-dependent dehydrogenase (short-subunit alcohol dehydrogenase family)
MDHVASHHGGEDFTRTDLTMPVSRLHGTTALVTGSSSGAGAAIARELARQGARIAVHCRRAVGEAVLVVKQLSALGAEACAFRADLGQPQELHDLVRDVEARMGTIGVLVNNAGPFADAPFRSLTQAQWDEVMAVNLRAPYLITQLLAPGMERLGWGRIINIGATSAYVRSHSVYGLAKAALLHLTESLALELAPTICVNAVVPSQIASARTDRMPMYKEAAIRSTPLRRLVTEDEIARMVALLCTPEFDFVTGRAIVMDGGRTLPSFPRIGSQLPD